MRKCQVQWGNFNRIYDFSLDPCEKRHLKDEVKKARKIANEMIHDIVYKEKVLVPKDKHILVTTGIATHVFHVDICSTGWKKTYPYQ